MSATQPHFQNPRLANVNELVILVRYLHCVAFPNSAVNRTRAARGCKEENSLAYFAKAGHTRGRDPTVLIQVSVFHHSLKYPMTRPYGAHIS